LAVRAGVPAAFVERLVDLGIVAAADDGTFSDADVYKVRFVRSSDLGGLSIEAIARSIRERRFSLAFMEGTHYRWAALSSRTYAEVAEESGFSVDLVLSFEEALGKVRPEPTTPPRRTSSRFSRSHALLWKLGSIGGHMLGFFGSTRSRSAGSPRRRATCSTASSSFRASRPALAKAR
jgi:hypothetical protein